jgi:hypothetical protein
MPKLGDRYYTGREVQRKLGITEPALRNLVNQRKLRKIIPPGRQYGVYLKEEVDIYAEKWLAFLTTEEPPKTTFGIAQAEDMEAENDLAQRAIGSPGRMTADIRRSWLAKNPEGHYHLKYKNKLVAFFWILPVKHDRLIAFMNGEIRGGDLTPEDVETFEPGRPVECFIVGIASEPDVGELTRMHYVQHLLRGVKREMEQLGRRGIIITKLYVTSDTPSGIAMALHAGMDEYGPRMGKRLRFVMDIAGSNSFLLDDYKRGLSEWRKEQENQTKIGRKTGRRTLQTEPIMPTT